MADSAQPAFSSGRDEVVPAALSDPLTVNAQSAMEDGDSVGPFTDSDYWSLSFRFQDGTVFYVNDYKCDLKDEDDIDTAGPMFASINGFTFQPGLKSVQNKFPYDARIRLFHHYSDYPDSINDFGSVGPGDKSTFWPVYYLSGAGHTDTDHWKVGVNLRVDPPRNQTEVAGKEFFNETLNKSCELAGSVAGQRMTFTVDGAGFTMDPGNGSCFDKWTTPLGYNSLAFIRLRNYFQQDMLRAVLSHKYSTDKTFEYEFGSISTDQQSSELEMMEFFTGPGHTGYDYWTLAAYLKDGTWYRSSVDKQCYLTSTDAGKTIPFTVDESKLHLGLDGSCDDTMVKQNAAADL
ncbi:hypothetical protein B0T24DRAFT_680821 [Lasiosphaeria ovina]|uniref:Up-regulated in Daf-2 domain-containing protein n=1 Tax=Lasiosphaeria ovina TaxID=92902 RepID=A0AAE0K9C9_9PEZI|nr:hypothetical protein B0T24DRAFT_680821 [Lasiosphaeria ovina]